MPLRVLIYSLLAGDSASMVKVCHFHLQGGNPDRQSGATEAFTFTFRNGGVIYFLHN